MIKGPGTGKENVLPLCRSRPLEICITRLKNNSLIRKSQGFLFL